MTLHVHGWVEILSSTYESDYVDEREAVARIEDELRRGPLLGVRVDAENGAYMLAVSLVQNREVGVKEQLSQLLAFVAAVAPGSYGVVTPARQRCGRRVHRLRGPAWAGDRRAGSVLLARCSADRRPLTEVAATLRAHSGRKVNG
jgi:hypothetical protein